jgi:hypothetical protein
MKSKGIKFTIISEEDAKLFLENNNYYMKLASYRTNYDKQKENCRNKGEYINLEFAYLKELSTIDMHLRYKIMEMCLDIEHHIKLAILNGITKEGEDGYQLIRKFIAQNDKVLKKIHAHQASNYCKGLIDKYYPYFPAWVFMELISFGDLTYLCDFYHKTYNDEIEDAKFLNIVRDLRNASAHSNCLINRLSDEIDGVPDKRILDFVKKLKCAGKTAICNNMKHRFMYDFIVLLYVYDDIIKNDKMKKKRYEDLKGLLENRFARNKDYFQKNNLIKSQYRFLLKVIDSLNHVS